MREPKGCGGFPRTQRRVVALAESKLLAVETGADGEARVRLSAYVRVENGAVGTAWEQELLLVLARAQVLEFPGETLWITRGELVLDGAPGEQPDELELPFERSGAVRIELAGEAGRLVATARGARVEEVGDPRFVERLDP